LVRVARVRSSAYLEAKVDGAGRGIDGEGVSTVRVASLEEGDLAAVAVHEVGGGEARDARAHHRHRPALGGGRHLFRRGNARDRSAARAGRRVTRERVSARGRKSFAGGCVRPRGSNVASVAARDVGMPEGTPGEVFVDVEALFFVARRDVWRIFVCGWVAWLEHPRVRPNPAQRALFPFFHPTSRLPR
jgi:hypothetical protein